MIIFSIGLPGRFAEWCDAAVACVVARLGDGVMVKPWPALADMLGYDGVTPVLDKAALLLLGTTASHLVMGTRQPDERLRSVLAETNARFVVALDDPRAAVADILSETNADLRSVTRAVANSCPFVMRHGLLPGALVIERQRAERDAAGTMRAIATHLGIAIDEDEAGGIVDDLASHRPTYAAARLHGGAPDGLPPAGTSMVDGALEAYAALAAGGAMGRIVWTRDLFIVASNPHNRPTDALDVCDVAGTDRFLIYGPYIRVPPGLWVARVTLGLSAETAGHTFVIDAFAGRPLASLSLRSVGNGVYAPELTFSIDPSIEDGLEIRVMVGSDNATGQLAFGNVALRLMAVAGSDDSTDRKSNFRTVLAL